VEVYVNKDGVDSEDDTRERLPFYIFMSPSVDIVSLDFHKN